MKLILTKQQFLGMNPIYGLELPEYLKQILNMSEDQYYQAGMEQTQRIINAYLQDFLLNLDWNISQLDYRAQEKIKEILFLEFEYLHQNQLWFEKSNDITYSTAGQQTFTFNSNLSEKEGIKLIPDYVIKIIKNTGILTFAASYKELQKKAAVIENQFADGYLVPDVEWSSKADNLMSINGSNVTLSQAITNLQNTSLKNDNIDFLNAKKLVENVQINNNNLNWSKQLTTSNFYPNKNNNDYAQIQDLNNVWIGSNLLIQNNTKDIQANQSAINELNNSKVGITELQSYLEGKANIDFSNVNLGKRPKNQYINVDINGKIYFTNASGNLSATVWQYDREYFNGDAVYVVENGVAVIYLAKDMVGNINKNPTTNPDFWIKYKSDVDLSEYLTATEIRNEFLAKSGGSISGNIDMQNNAINNVSNLLEKTVINDNEKTTNTLWSSQKIDDEINNKALILNKVETQNVAGNVIFENSIQFNKSIGIYKNNVGGIFMADENGNVNLQLNNTDAKFTINGEGLKNEFNEFAKINEQNTFTQNQNFSSINSTNSNLQNAEIGTLNVSADMTVSNLNATGSISVNNSELATQDHVNHAISQVYENLGQYNITTWEGVWRSTTNYTKGAMVKYEPTGVFYISNITNNLNNIPPNTPDYWTQTSGSLSVNLDNYLTIGTNQNISGLKTVTRTGEMIKFQTPANESNFISFFSGNTRKALFGKESSTNNNFVMVAEAGNLKLSGTNIDVNNKKIINVADAENINSDNQAVNVRFAKNNFVSLNQNQILTGEKTFNSNRIYFKFTGNEGWMEFKKSNNSRLGLIGKADDNDRFWIWSDIDNIQMRAPSGKNVEISEGNNVIAKKTPTHDFHLTNKKYVDNLIQNNNSIKKIILNGPNQTINKNTTNLLVQMVLSNNDLNWDNIINVFYNPINNGSFRKEVFLNSFSFDKNNRTLNLIFTNIHNTASFTLSNGTITILYF